MRNKLNCRVGLQPALALLLLTTVLWFRDPLQAAPGDLDPTFGTGGKVTTNISLGLPSQAMAIQADGKIVVGGFLFNGANNDFIVLRFKSDGNLDTSFGTNGMVMTDFSNNNDDFSDLVIQADGKIVAVGTVVIVTNVNKEKFGLVRYDSDGSLDTSFGIDGKVTTDFGTSRDIARAMAIQVDSRIVVGGVTSDGNNKDFALARYNPDGSLDTSFGVGGKVITDLGTINEDLFDLAVQPDGKIVVFGPHTSSSFIDDFVLVRYNSDGSLDTSFGTEGKVSALFGSNNGSNNDGPRALAIQSDGKIVLAGIIFNGANHDFALARYNTDGTLDTTFGTGGMVVTDFGNNDSDGATALAIQPDGKIVLAGSARTSNNENFALARYNTDGTLDNTFGTDGRVTTDFGSDTDFALAVAMQADGKPVAAGHSPVGFLALARYTADDAPPALVLDPSSLNFGPVAVGSSKDLNFTIQNTGGGILEGSCNTGAPFSLPSGCSFSLVANQSKAITVRFSPKSRGISNGNVNFTSNGGNPSPIVTGTGVKKLANGRITVNGGPVQNVIVVRLGPAPNFKFKQLTKTDTEGKYFFTEFSKEDYIIPISSGTSSQLDNTNDGVHGYRFSPSFCQIGVNDGRRCSGDNKNQISQDFTASLKPAPLEPITVFKLPLPSGSWRLSVEAGGYAVTSKNPVDADPAHTDLSRSGFYALDFPNGSSSASPILASKGGTVFDKDKMPAFGKFVIIDHGDGYYTRYAHLDKFAPGLKKGMAVNQGDFLGCMGKTGVGEGVHLHFQIYYGGQSREHSLSDNPQLRMVRLETGNKGLIPLIEFVAGQSYQSTNASVSSSVCGK